MSTSITLVGKKREFSESQRIITVCVCMCIGSLCLVKIAEDVEISPICGILWRSLFTISISLSLSISVSHPLQPPHPWRSNRGGIWLRRGLSIQVRKAVSICKDYFLPLCFVSDVELSVYAPICVYVCVCVFRSRAVVSIEAALILTPRILNPDDRQCQLPQTDFMVTW